jgi:hypothetical protein
MKRYSILFAVCLQMSLGCAAMGTATYEQPLVVPAPTTANGNPCAVIGAGKVSWSGIDLAGRMPHEFASANSRVLTGAGTYVVLCSSGEAVKEASRISYGANGVWGNNSATEALKQAKLADAKANDIIKTFAKHGASAPTVKETPSVEPQPQPAVAQTAAPAADDSNLLARTAAAKNYDDLIVIFAASSHKGLVEPFMKAKASPNSSFEKDKDALIKALKLRAR